MCEPSSAFRVDLRHSGHELLESDAPVPVLVSICDYLIHLCSSEMLAY